MNVACHRQPKMNKLDIYIALHNYMILINTQASQLILVQCQHDAPLKANEKLWEEMLINLETPKGGPRSFCHLMIGSRASSTKTKVL